MGKFHCYANCHMTLEEFGLWNYLRSVSYESGIAYLSGRQIAGYFSETNKIFVEKLGEGRWQSRTEPEDEGVEIRDLLFGNKSDFGFWQDLKNKYFASEIVVDAKNKSVLTRDDLRQLYCYLKPALGFWGFVVCRSEQPKWVYAYNRTLFRNFNQGRGVLILCDDDLRRMVHMKNQGRDPSEYLREKMSDFTRSI